MKNVNFKIWLVMISMLTMWNVHAAQDMSQEAPDVITDTKYMIGPGDTLLISVWKEEGMQQEVMVRPDGGITFPLAGEVQAGGLSANALTDVLTKKLKKYIPHPNVTVSVLSSISNKVYVIGKVNRPGEYVATGYMDVLQALTMAGGLTPYADSDDIKIIRRTSEGNMIKVFDYDDVISGDRLDMNIILKAGDTVVVP